MSPTGQHPAKPAAKPDGSGAPKDVAEGAITNPRPDPHPGDGRRIVGWLVMRAPKPGGTPTVRSWCVCGRNLGATGYPAGGSLIADHDDHRATCPEQVPQEDRRAA
ncbi:hypothetical protein OHB39_11795 [Streptomyces sp. NBC_00047]|uniref:hypothetical protein n=1 Tax=Streptomyces sp. NBC_00047 TaxID=2975627 RepID=UPI002252FD54|nr:hypothetical protein [Streptomyces sp. NBC_00047]MCX5608245.1 hypothetical protein [Streptomyces sp. NBC_00047]